MILHAYVDVYVLCVCIVGHGGDYTTKDTLHTQQTTQRPTWVAKPVRERYYSTIIKNISLWVSGIPVA